jgi:arginine repressor
MLSEVENRILEFASKRHLVTKGEIADLLQRNACNGTDSSVSRLSEMGYLEKIESLGTCFVITQKGMRIAKGQV